MRNMDTLEKAIAYLRHRIASGKMRKYASFFDWPDKSIKERGVVNNLFSSMRKAGCCQYSNVAIAEHDPPDCIATDEEGNTVGIEVSELVDEEAVRRNQQGKDVYRLWDADSVIDHIQQILLNKDGKPYQGGPYAKLILVIHTDEPEITPECYIPIIQQHTFAGMRQIDEAYLLFSYIPAPAMPDYPFIRLNFSCEGSPRGGHRLMRNMRAQK